MGFGSFLSVVVGLRVKSGEIGCADNKLARVDNKSRASDNKSLELDNKWHKPDNKPRQTAKKAVILAHKRLNYCYY